MAESTLSVSYTDLQGYVARFAGWDRTSGSWETEQAADFEVILKSGLRKFYFPPPIEPGSPAYAWEFLKKVNTETFVSGTYSYSLPDDFSGIFVPRSVSHVPDTDKRIIKEISDQELAALRGGNDLDGTPVYCAVAPDTNVPATGHRWLIKFYPVPDITTNFRYRYVYLPNTLSSVNLYPAGGAMHSETLVEAVLASAEAILDDDPQGVHQSRFMELLAASIKTDRESVT